MMQRRTKGINIMMMMTMILSDVHNHHPSDETEASIDYNSFRVSSLVTLADSDVVEDEDVLFPEDDSGTDVDFSDADLILFR